MRLSLPFSGRMWPPLSARIRPVPPTLARPVPPKLTRPLPPTRTRLPSERPPRIGRLAVRFGLALTLSMGLAGAIAFTVARQQLITETDESLQGERDKLVLPGQRNDAAALVPRIAARMAHRAISTKGYLLYAADGRQLWSGVDMPMPPEGFSAVRYHNGTPKWHEGRAFNSRLPGGGRLIVVEHVEVTEDTQQMLLTGLIVLVVTGSLAGFLAAWLLAAEIGRSLSRTVGAADAIASGDLSRRIPVEGLDGIFSEQAASLNHMIDRMEQMVRSQRQFSSHLAHDLRTPLTRLLGLFEESREGADPERSRLCDRATRECRSIIAIFDALLRLSQIEAGRRLTAMTPVSLAAIVEDAAETMESVVADAGIALDVAGLAPATVLADTGLLQQLLVNLLENIVFHTPNGTRSRVELTREAGEAVITIADNGPGIASADHARVMRPFEQGVEPDRRLGGSGLGLAIAQAIMRFHNGVLELADNRPGLIVRLRFPAIG